MTKIQDNSENTKNNSIIPYGSYCTDSFKLSIDVDKLTKVDIPENFILTSADTGEIIKEFKKNSLEITYKNTTIYVGLFRRILNGKHYDKLMILFSSKVADQDYFNGIKKHHVINVLNFLKELRYIDFTDVSEVYKNIYTGDHDIKVDFCLKKNEREKIAKFNSDLKAMFQFENSYCHVYNGEKQGFGITTFHRDRYSLAKPFVKWYDKNKELNKKHPKFFATLPEDVRDEVLNNFIYRFEFTMKNKDFFTKFGLSNRLEEVLEVTNDKWHEVGKTLLKTLFEPKVKQIRDNKKLTYSERILSLYFFEDIQKHNISPMEVKVKYTSIQKTKEQKYKAGKLFDRIYQITSQDHASEIIKDYESINHYYKVFGFI
jgi:hypothetical protein